ncbi:MAG: hypothetical protein HRT93_08195 [Piscirickettsiaceae bacterium]|nr:hypothetical protein [Piscirickettsiaceae bacterium]
MKVVIQQQKTGCAIASAAAIADISYQEARTIANGMGIFTEDVNLWSKTDYIRKLLQKLGVEIAVTETPFSTWESLPNCALLAIKWQRLDDIAYWHWVVFVREGEQSYVLDSNKGLKTNKRTDFGRIKPKWFIAINS